MKGRLVYSGRFESVIPYFLSLGFEVPPFENPSDYFMSVMQTDPEALIEGWSKASKDEYGNTACDAGPAAQPQHQQEHSPLVAVVSSSSSASTP